MMKKKQERAVNEEFLIFKGRQIERLEHEVWERLFFGYACVFFSFVTLFFWVTQGISKTNIGVAVFLLILGLISLSIGYSAKRRLKELK